MAFPIDIVIEHYRVPAWYIEAPKKGSPKPFMMFRCYRKQRCDNGLVKIDWAARGGATRCILRESDTGVVVAEAWALCSFGDNFSFKKGRLIAEGRAMKALKGE